MRVPSLVMSLKSIDANCKEILALATDDYLVAPDAEQSTISERLATLVAETRELIEGHNAIIDSYVGRTSAELSAVEIFKMNMHEICNPPEQDLDKPLKHLDELEQALLAKLPPHVGMAHRFARLVEQDVQPLFIEANIVASLGLNEEEHLTMDVE